ncbi:MAG: hypothetical protein C0616_11565 [Desulfuromonas sp.]|nr:MAG: hypothetical protein C0616_11565 [Desulfuromonas sp.]
MSSPPRRILLGLILLSGFSALIYEITWTRHLSLLFGSNMLAVGTVAATFMAGLAIGSLFFGTRADRSRNPLRLYALLEAGIALTALLFPLALNLIGSVFIPLAKSSPDGGGIITISRMALGALAVLPPTICMGGTLPVICRFLAGQQLGRLVGKLYALNTFGAVAGCLVGGFLLIPHFGMFTTQAIAIGVNLIIAIIAWRLGTTPGETTVYEDQQEAASTAAATPALLLLSGTALLGLSALAFEMLWTRLFLLFLGNTTYAFATILGVFLCGLTLGGAIYARWLANRENPTRVYAALVSSMLLYILATLPFYDRFGFLFEAIHRQAETGWWLLAGSSFLVVSLVMLVPAAFSGALFPATVALLNRGTERIGVIVGKVLFWNTLGAMLGSFLGVYAVLLFGLQDSFKAIALISLVYLGIFLWNVRTQFPRRHGIGLVMLPTLLLLVPLNWNQGLLNSGIYVYSGYYESIGGLERLLSAGQPDDVVEGIETTAAFYRTSEGYKEFRVNGKTDGGTTPGDMKTQVLLGQLPMLFRPDADTALVIGLGTGVTLRQVLDYPVKDVDCAEISPAVVAISKHFSDENENVLGSPRINLMVRDGRNLLLTGQKKYDVIISEPSNPWQTGNANLFTREFYRLAVSRLAERGIFCQWLPTYDLPTAKLQIALQTFADSFQHIRVFLLGGDMIMLGSPSPISLDIDPVESPESRSAILEHLALAGLDSPRQLFERYYFANETFVAAAAEDAPLNTDNLPHLEFTRQMGINRMTTNLRFLVNHRQQVGSKGIE